MECGFSKIAIALLCFTVISANAATNNLADCQLATVQTGLNSASAGDTLRLPNGTANWTNLLMINKSIKLVGNGKGNTILTETGTGCMVLMSNVPNSLVEVSGIEFRSTRTTVPVNFPSATIVIYGSDYNGGYFRLSSNFFNGITNTVVHVFDAQGVADHNEYNLRNNLNETFYGNYGGHGPYGDGSWATADSFGTTNAWYFENETAYYTNNTGFVAVTDGYRGARYVWRYGLSTNALVSSHGTESTQRYRGTRHVEAYMSTFFNPNGNLPYGMDLRSGVCYYWSNVCSGFSGTTTISMSDYRSMLPWNPTWMGADGTNGFDTNVVGGPFVTGTFTSVNTGALTATDNTKSWTTDQYKGYVVQITGQPSVTSVTRSSSTITVTQPGHGLTTGDWVQLSGAVQTDYNAVWVATVTDSDHWTATIFTTPTSPATGTIYGKKVPWYAEIESNTSTTLTLHTEQILGKNIPIASGQSYQIWKVVGAVDMPGFGQGNLLSGDTPAPTYLNQAIDPCRAWGNSMNSNTANTIAADALFMVAGVHYTNVQGSYTPLVYPHPIITADAGCSYNLDSFGASYSAAGGSGTIAVTAGTGCAWTAVANDSWLHITGGSSGTGNGTVSYSVDANSGNSRSGTLTVAGLTFTVNQGAPATGNAVVISGATISGAKIQTQ